MISKLNDPITDNDSITEESSIYSKSNISNSSSEYISSSSDENFDKPNNLELTGKILNHYNILYELGRGGFSIVWLAYNTINKNFYAIKIQDPNDFNDGLSEIKFIQKLSKNPNLFNNIIEYFIHKVDNMKYLCSVWDLHCSNIDGVIRKGNYNNGLPLDIVKKIMIQLMNAIKILHKKYKIFHGDIKTDNILIKGYNDKDLYTINEYTKLYNNRDNHEKITKIILENINKNEISKYKIDNKFIESIKISLSDFGTFCEENNYYENSFGTRYYQAPEIILMGKCSYPVDIWALGCTFYELLSGKFLFDPNKDSKHNRDWFHLYLINQTCGDFSIKCIKNTKYYNNYFTNNKLIDIDSNTNFNYTRLYEKINVLNFDDSIKSEIIDLLKSMLTIDSTKRITIEELLNKSFFNN